MKPKSFKRQTIKLAIYSNTNANPADVKRFGTVQALVLGNFAVHNRGFYVITHVPSGMQASRSIEFQRDAKDLARKLERWFGKIEDLNTELNRNSHLAKRYRQLCYAAYKRYDGLK